MLCRLSRKGRPRVYRIREDTAPVVAATSGSVLGPRSSLSADRMAS